MYNPYQITTMAYETWACKNRPYLPGLTLFVFLTNKMYVGYQGWNSQNACQNCKRGKHDQLHSTPLTKDAGASLHGGSVQSA